MPTVPGSPSLQCPQSKRPARGSRTTVEGLRQAQRVRRPHQSHRPALKATIGSLQREPCHRVTGLPGAAPAASEGCPRSQRTGLPRALLTHRLLRTCSVQTAPAAGMGLSGQCQPPRSRNAVFEPFPTTASVREPILGEAAASGHTDNKRTTRGCLHTPPTSTPLLRPLHLEAGRQVHSHIPPPDSGAC